MFDLLGLFVLCLVVMLEGSDIVLVDMFNEVCIGLNIL